MLIKCIECGKQISDKAVSCPNCGYPIKGNEDQFQQSNMEEELHFPDLPDDLSLGKSLVTVDLDTSVHGDYKKEINNINGFVDGRMTVDLYENGIQLFNYKFNERNIKENAIILHIHKSQIISMNAYSETEIKEKNKSIVGRAIVGGILTGGFGAVVGGMTGIGTKKKEVIKWCFVMEFWDVCSKSKETITLINASFDSLDFIKKYNKVVLGV